MKRKFLPVIAFFAVIFHAAAGFASEAAHAGMIMDPAEGYDHLWKEMMIDITVIGVIFALVTIYFLIRYRRKTEGQEGRPTKLSTAQVLGWALIPIFVFVADDFYLAAKGWTLWNNYRTPPANSYEINLESAMWSWNFKYDGGVETVNELRVPAGKPVVLQDDEPRHGTQSLSSGLQGQGRLDAGKDHLYVVLSKRAGRVYDDMRGVLRSAPFQYARKGHSHARG